MKRGQVWIETVIYTTIALVMIGLVLSYSQPKIEEIRHKIILDQSLEVLDDIRNKVIDIVQGGAGNKRLLEVSMKEGDLVIDAETDSIFFEMNSRYAFGEPGKEISVGKIKTFTTETGRIYKVRLTMNYSEYNLTYDGQDKVKTLGKAANLHRVFITNKGETIHIVNNEDCSDIDDCSDIEGYEKISCGDFDSLGTNDCKYKAKKTTINFEVE